MELLRRFVVAEGSMRPALEPGDGLLAVPLRRPRKGSVCVVRRPGADDFWLVKRIAGVAGDVVEVEGRRWPVGDGEVFVLSDDTAVTVADSRRYGPLPVAGAYRVVLRVPGEGRRHDERSATTALAGRVAAVGAAITVAVGLALARRRALPRRVSAPWGRPARG